MGIKISELTSATSLTGSEELPIVQAGNTKKATISQVKAQNYSTTEQVVGTWIDGKPLYQKTIVDTTNSASYSINVNDLNIELCVEIRGLAKSNDSNTSLPFGFYVSSSAYFSVLYSDTTANQEIGIRTTNSYANYTKYITIYYTKTTDTATQTRSTNLATLQTMNTGALVGSGEKSNLLLEDFSGDKEEEKDEEELPIEETPLEETPLEEKTEVKESGENDELR